MSRIKMDTHCHTEFSFDCETAPIALCEAAIEKGITHLAITDHCDYDCILSGVYDPYPAEKAKEAIERLKKKYAGRLDIIYGVELGGAHVVPEAAKELLEKQGFEFVLGSLHNLRGVPDFYFMNFADMPDSLIESLIKRNIAELCEIAALPFVDSIAHVTYPLRYMKAQGRTPDISRYIEEFTGLFEAIIKSGKALEVNTSPYRKGIEDTMPEKELLRLYKKLGGTRITLGSDAHTAEGVGDGISEAVVTLKELGFDSVTLYDAAGETQVPLTDLK